MAARSASLNSSEAVAGGGCPTSDGAGVKQVKAGQPLVRLDPTATGSELGSGEAQAAAEEFKTTRNTYHKKYR